MRIEICKNFATAYEIDQLNNWTDLGVKQKWLDSGITEGRQQTVKRLTSRFYSNRYQYPQVALDLSARIRKFVGVDAFPLIEGHGQNGIVVSYTMPGGDVYKHKDPRGPGGLATLRCNILTRQPEAGCQLYVEGVPVGIGVGDLHCYLVSEHEHWATAVDGSTSRIMWMFGAHVPAEEWNAGHIKLG